MTGIILIDKPEGMTSFSAVARVRRLTGQKKCGHTGTLDPLATGVLPVMLGGATKFCELLPSSGKAYTASLRLGEVTDTLDISGEVVLRREVKSSTQDFEAALEQFRGEIMQVPPMYSAISKNGVRLYELARRGIEVEREAREVEIKSLTLEHADEGAGEYIISVECSAGTYIRSLIYDIGESLGCGAVMTALRRTYSNGFKIEDCMTLEEFERRVALGELESAVLSTDAPFAPYPCVTVTEPQARRFKNGGALSAERLRGKILPDTLYRVLSPEGDFLGLGEKKGDELAVRRLLVD